MEYRLVSYLEDILNAISEIKIFMSSINRFSEYQNDLKGKRAIERNLEIVGEAINRILKVDENMPISNARKIVDTRNRISHGYDSVSDEII
jgi:uncharacterized protein with HEPN domain